MKKLSKIFAVVLCLALALSMLPAASAATVEKSIKYTADNLGLAAYADGTATVGGIATEYTELSNYGDGIQMRLKNNGGKLWNTAALPGGITKIVFTWSATKTNGYSNANCIDVHFGNAARGEDCTMKLSTVAGDVLATYTITPDGTDYTYFTVELVDAHTYYWDSIEVFYNETVAGGDTGNGGNQGGTTGDGSNQGGTTGDGGNQGGGEPDKAGDNTAILGMSVVMVMAVAAMAVLVIGKKKLY